MWAAIIGNWHGTGKDVNYVLTGYKDASDEQLQKLLTVVRAHAEGGETAANL